MSQDPPDSSLGKSYIKKTSCEIQDEDGSSVGLRLKKVEVFTVRVNHSGKFDDTREFYIGGRLDDLTDCSKNNFNLSIIHDFVKNVSSLEIKTCFFVIPNRPLSHRTLIELCTDDDLNTMLEWLNLDVDTYFVYVSHESETKRCPSAPGCQETLETVDSKFHDVSVYLNSEFVVPFEDFDDCDYEGGNESDSCHSEDEEEYFRDKYLREDKVRQAFNNEEENIEVGKEGYNYDSFTDAEDSDDLISLPSDDSEDDEYIRGPKVRDFNPERDIGNPVFDLGMKFANCKQFRKAIKEYAILNKKKVKLVRNERYKLRAECLKPCPWFVYVSKMPKCDTLQVKTIHKKHVNCRPVFENSNVNSTWLAEKYLEQIRSNPEWPLTAFMDTVRHNQNISVSRSQVYRAKRKARKVIDGDHRKQFALIWDYCKELKRAMPGTTTKVDYVEATIDGSAQLIFKRMYCALGPCKYGFRDGCRPIIFVDGCFLKVCSLFTIILYTFVLFIIFNIINVNLYSICMVLCMFEGSMARAVANCYRH